MYYNQIIALFNEKHCLFLWKPAVIIDNGSYCIKAGFSCDNHPVAIFRTVVGRPTDIVGRYGRPGRQYEVYIGDEAGEDIFTTANKKTRLVLQAFYKFSFSVLTF